MITSDETVLDHVLAACATADVQPTVVGDPGAVRAVWSVAPVVIVGVDQAAELARLVLPHRDQIFVVGDSAHQTDLCEWSVPLCASVIVLPSGAAWLASVLADAQGTAGKGLVVVLLGGSGGVGASTVAASLAWTAARRGTRAMLVDLDPSGGGIDLLVGAERLEGWRWPRLLGARGHLGDLDGQIPHLDGMDVLAMARDDCDDPPTPDAVAAVLASAGRSHQLVLVDVGRELAPSGREAIRRADVTFVLSGTDVRALAAARQTTQRVRPLARDLRLLVRSARTSLGSSVAAEAVGLTLFAVVPDDPWLPDAAERGDPPGRGNRPRWNKSCRDLLDRLVLP